jgi:hypothetical protein
MWMVFLGIPEKAENYREEEGRSRKFFGSQKCLHQSDLKLS